jgi:hypothetical protein
VKVKSSIQNKDSFSTTCSEVNALLALLHAKLSAVKPVTLDVKMKAKARAYLEEKKAIAAGAPCTDAELVKKYHALVTAEAQDVKLDAASQAKIDVIKAAVNDISVDEKTPLKVHVESANTIISQTSAIVEVLKLVFSSEQMQKDLSERIVALSKYLQRLKRVELMIAIVGLVCIRRTCSYSHCPIVSAVSCD